MITKKDVEGSKAFWVAAISSRVVLPNGEEAERRTYSPNGWYLLGKPYPFLKAICRSKSGMVLMLDSLEEQLKYFDDEGLTALQYELDMFREDFDDFLTPEQVEWFNRMYDIVSSELDARWLLKKLEERRIVKIERGN